MESNVYSKTLTLLHDDPNIFDVLEKALAFEEENRGNKYYLGFEWYEVAGIGVGSGKHARLQLMIRSAAHKLVEGRGCLP